MSIPTFKLDLLLELRKKYVVYLLSNTNEIHWQWSCLHAFRYKAFRAEDFFEHIYLSYEMKMAKPDADIFQKVLDETGILPNETLFIDDSEVPDSGGVGYFYLYAKGPRGLETCSCFVKHRTLVPVQV